MARVISVRPRLELVDLLAEGDVLGEQSRCFALEATDAQ